MIRPRAGLLLWAALAAWGIAGCGGGASSTATPDPGRAELTEELRSSDPAVRIKAARAIGSRAIDCAWAAPELAAALRDTSAAGQDPEVRVAELTALGWIGPRAASALPEVTALARDENPLVRQCAIEALGQIAKGSADLAAGARPELLEGLRAEDPAVRSAAAMAVGRIELAAAAPELAVMMAEDPEPAVRNDAARALMWIGARVTAAQAETIGPALIAQIEARRGEVSEHAATALGKIAAQLGAESRTSAADALIGGLKGGRGMAVRSAESLGAMAPVLEGDARGRAIEALKGAAGSRDVDIRDAAKRSLRDYGVESL